MISEPTVLPAVTMTEDLNKAIQAAVSAADVRTLIMAEAERVSAVSTQLATDQANAEKAAADKIVADQAAAAGARSFARKEIIGGKSFTFDGASEAEVDRAVLNAYKIAYAVREPEAAQVVVDPAIAAAEAQRVAETELLAKTDLERRFKLGEITASDYIQQSGAMKEYLAKEGVDLDSLKTIVEANRDTKYKQSWAEAGATFQNSPAGADWPGGNKNQELLGLKIAAMGLADAPDKVAALAQAYAEMKRTNLYFPNGDGEAAPVLEPDREKAAVVAAAAQAATAADAARVAEALRATAAAKSQSWSSSLFGQSSGMSGGAIESPATTDAKKAVPADATPAEIMAAWKEGQLAAGKDLNESFLSEHRAGSTR